MSGAGTGMRRRLPLLGRINGYFTQGIIPSTGSLGGAYLGAAVIRITG